MKSVFITGGIGSGKSEVCRYLAWRGVPVYDADSETKALYERDPALVSRLCDALGQPLCDADGRLDRRRLAALVFHDEAALATLERIVHPAVLADFLRWRDAQEERAHEGNVPFVVMESAIVLDKALFHGIADRVILVDAPLEVRIARAAARDGVEPEAIRARAAAQHFPASAAAGLSGCRIDAVITNTGSLDELHAATDRVFAGLWTIPER